MAIEPAVKHVREQPNAMEAGRSQFRWSAGETGHDVQALKVAGFGHSQQASGGDFTGSTPMAEADLAPLNTGASESTIRTKISSGPTFFGSQADPILYRINLA